MGIGGLQQGTASGDVHAFAARVQAWPGESSHFEVNEEGDVILHCVRHHGGTPVKANLCGVDSSGNGSIFIPDPGTEVMLGSDSGDFEGELYLLGCYPTGRPPDGLVSGKLFLINTNIELRSTTTTILGNAISAGGPGSLPTIIAPPFLGALQTVMEGMTTVLAAINSYAVAIKAIADPMNSATPTLTTALTTTWTGVLSTFEGLFEEFQTTILTVK